MERKINETLLKWKKDPARKTMLLYGVPGCGKTYSILEFGKKEYKNTIYFDASDNVELEYVLDKNATVDKVIRGLSAISLETIFQEDTLIVLDNVNASVLDKVKKLFAINNNYHIIMITNDKNLVNNKKSEEIVIKTMNLVTFFEYLKYIGKEQLIDFIIDSFKTNVPMPFHSMAFELYNNYLITGGYPEIIVSEDCKDSNILNSYLQRNILLQQNSLLELDNLIDIKRGNELYNNIYMQLVKDNKKFQYGLLKQGARAKEYNNAVNFLVNSDLVLQSFKVSDIKTPISKYKEPDSFKLYYSSAGILFKKLGIHQNKLITDNRIIYLLYENDIACSLKQNGLNLYYHQSGGKSEVDFVIQTRTGKLIPIEIIKKNMAKSKSLKLTMNKYELKEAIRISEDNFGLKNGIKYVPFYAVSCITEMM